MNTAFKVGDKVRKVGGDYTLEGVVVAAFRKTSGKERYVVEADVPAGLLHICSAENLKLLGPPCDRCKGTGEIRLDDGWNCPDTCGACKGTGVKAAAA